MGRSCPLKILTKYQNSRKAEETNILSNPVVFGLPKALPKTQSFPRSQKKKNVTENFPFAIKKKKKERDEKNVIKKKKRLRQNF